MQNGSRLRPAVLVARERLARGREKLRAQHDSGSPGIQVCAHLTDLLDTILLDLFQDALEELDGEPEDLSSSIALIPHGGYGRRDMAPFSDVDLMLLHDDKTENQITPLVRRLTHNLYDAGIDLGFSVRTPSQACSMALKDSIIFTSLAESRYLGGSVRLYSKFASKFRRQAKFSSRKIMSLVESSRRDERRQHGETVNLLAPNIKRSRGGLRDIQLVRWIGFARYQEVELQNLSRAGVLWQEDQKRLRGAREFLLRLRNEMHFHAGRSQDILDRDEQLRIAEVFGYKGEEGLLPVEQFMQDYFHNTVQVRNSAAHFLASARHRPILNSFLGPLFSHQIEGDFRAGMYHISATKRGLEKVRGDLDQVLRLMDLSNLYNKRIDHSTWEAIRETMSGLSTVELSSSTIERFLSLLSQPPRLGDLLRRLHELRVLEKIIPPMKRTRCLLQFNEYHKYTVDEHTFRAVESATEFLNHPGALGEAYRSVKRKRTLHLALLLHDLGKGYVEDHSDVGKRIALDMVKRLKLTSREAEKLTLLVHKHLLMAHTALRLDINDQSVVLRFAAEIGSADTLQMLYVLSCADLAAVGPGVLNAWKLELLTDLYTRTMHCLAGDAPSATFDEGLQNRRWDLQQLAKDRQDAAWWNQQIDALPKSYLYDSEPGTIIAELERLHQLTRDDAVAWGRYLPERKAVQYTIGAYEEIAPGIFHRLTGALTSKGMQILSAEIHTLDQGLALDRFFVHDLDFSGEPPPQRLEEIQNALVEALCSAADEKPTFRKIWKSAASDASARLKFLPTKVSFDNSTAERSTILTVFAYDRLGLLYTITRTLFELNLSVKGAKIGTFIDQVADVFYVVDQNGGKIEDEHRMAEIRTRLLEAIEKEKSSDS